jgi:hypothetical protein
MPEPAETEIDLPFPGKGGKFAQLWDTLTIDGEEYPGKVDVEAEIERKVDVRRVRGRDGGRITDHGLEPTTVTLTFHAWTDVHFAALRALIPRFAARQRLRDRKPFDAYHPALEALGITQLYTTKVGNVRPGGQKGLWEMRVTAIEYFPPPRRRVTRTPATAAGAGGLAGVEHVGVNTNVAGDKRQESPRSNGASNP